MMDGNSKSEGILSGIYTTKSLMNGIENPHVKMMNGNIGPIVKVKYIREKPSPYFEKNAVYYGRYFNRDKSVAFNMKDDPDDPGVFGFPAEWFERVE